MYICTGKEVGMLTLYMTPRYMATHRLPPPSPHYCRLYVSTHTQLPPPPSSLALQEALSALTRNPLESLPAAHLTAEQQQWLRVRQWDANPSDHSLANLSRSRSLCVWFRLSVLGSEQWI